MLDGLITDTAWNIVDWSGSFVQSEPNEGAQPLFVAIRCFDNEPEKIAVPVTPHDNFKGDWVDININSDLDKNTASSFTIKASGIRGDEFINYYKKCIDLYSENLENKKNESNYKLALKRINKEK